MLVLPPLHAQCTDPELRSEIINTAMDSLAVYYRNVGVLALVLVLRVERIESTRAGAGNRHNIRRHGHFLAIWMCFNRL